MSGYYFYQSNNLEKLLSEHLDILISENPLDISRVIVLKDKPMRTWFSLQISKLKGIAFNLSFKTPIELILDLLEELGLKERLIFHDDLYFLIVKELEKMEQEKHKNLLNSYLLSSKDAFNKEKKRSHLARQMSKYFYDYFSEGEDYLLRLKSHSNEIYRLQYQIYESIFIKQGYQELYACLEKLQKENKRYDGKLKQINIFGSSFVSPPFHRFFEFLSQSIDVHHFGWTPSKLLSEPIHEIERTPVKKWMKPLKESLNLLRKNKQITLKFQNVYSIERIDSLSVIKKNLLRNDNEKQALIFDNSFQIFSAKTLKRELEVIKDKILSFLDENANLQLHDIAVLAPNIDDYAAFIEEVFSREETPLKLPYNIIDLNSQEESKLKQGFFNLLDLSFSRFEVDKILALCKNPYFLKAKNLGEEDLEVLQALIKTYDVKWAMNKEHKESLELGNLNTFTFTHAFEKLYEAMIDGGEKNPNIESDVRKILITWTALLEELYRDIKEIQHSKKTIEGWANHLSKLLEKYFYSSYLSDEEKNEIIVLRSIIKKLYQTEKDLNLKENQHYKDKNYSLTSILDAISSFSFGKKKAHYSATGVTFSSLIPFRATPFKVIFIMGLNEETFLNESKLSGIDFQKEISNEKKDNEEKQFAFLEMLYAAKEKFILSYLDFDWERKEEKDPSPLIEELLYSLIQTFDLPQMNTEKNRDVNSLLKFLKKKSAFHSFDIEHFKKDAPLPSYNNKSYQTLKILLTPTESTPTETPMVKIKPPKDFSLTDLKHFLKDPVKHYMRQTLNITLEEENSIESEESLSLNALDISKIKRECLEKLNFEEPNPKHFEEIIEESFSSFKKEKALSFLDFSIDKEKRFFHIQLNTLKNFLNEHRYHLFSTESINSLSFGEYLIEPHIQRLYQSSNKNYLSFILGDSLSYLPQAYVEILYLFNHEELDVETLSYFFLGKDSVQKVHLQKKEDFKKNLNNLLFLYEENLKTPIFLYPDLAKSLEKALEKNEPSEEMTNKINLYFKENDSNFGSKKMFTYHPYAPFFLREFQNHSFNFVYEGMLKKMLEDVYLPLSKVLELSHE